MAGLSSNTKDNEQNKFDECQGNVVVRTKICQDTGESIKVEIDGTVATTPEIFNVNMVNSGTEYSLDLPIGTKQFSLNIKDNESKFELSFVSSGNTITIPRGSSYDQINIKIEDANKTVFFKGFKNNLIMEVVTWR